MSPDPLPLEALARILGDRLEVLEAYVFGSRARGEAHGESDLDVAVYVDRGVPVDAPFGYAAELTRGSVPSPVSATSWCTPTSRSTSRSSIAC